VNCQLQADALLEGPLVRVPGGSSAIRKFPAPPIPISMNGESPGINSTRSEVMGFQLFGANDHKVSIIDVSETMDH
jgi:hypothetical protein